LAAIAAAYAVGVPVNMSVQALQSFENVRRRLELRGEVRGVQVYDDFAHHPTAIAATVQALKERVSGRVLAVIEPRSNTMRLGTHASQLEASLIEADLAYAYAPPSLNWDTNVLGRVQVFRDLPLLVQALAAEAKAGDAVLLMSNGSFGGVHGLLLQAL
jgi:UDP-N-acetylmuramate: L-alanyl-gamma-D-glutamyl-meso-diaminopimelate ligase